jgi:hypothetical protein
MVALWVREDTEGQRGSVNDMRERNYTRSFTVTCSSLVDGSEAAINAIGIPRLWVPYFNILTGFVDLGSWCRNVDATRVKKGSTVWKVICSYNSKLDRPDINQIENPLMRPAEISWDTTSTAVPMLVDAENKVVRNSAGDLYDPPPEMNVKTLQLTITRNQPDYDAAFYLDFEDSVNQLPFMSLPRRSWKCAHIKGTRAFETGLYFWKVTMQFETKKARDPANATLKPAGAAFAADESKAWVKWLLDRGFRQKKTPTAEPTLCTDPTTKQVLSTPALLDGAGKQLATAAKPVYFGYRPYPDMDFNGLNLF